MGIIEIKMKTQIFFLNLSRLKSQQILYYRQIFELSMESTEEKTLEWSEFMKVEMRVGTIVSAEEFKEVKNPAYKMVIDFGEYGLRKTSAQITELYVAEELIGQQVIAVVNFPAKQIANMMSECLVLGGIGNNNEVTLVQPERKVENGTRIG